MSVVDSIFTLLDKLGPLPYTLEDLARVVLPKLPEGRMLADSEKRTLVAMAEVCLEGSPALVTPREAVETFERFLIQGQSKRAWRCRLLLTLVEYAPIVAYGRPVSMMSVDQRKRYVREKLMRGGFPWSTCAKVRYLAYAGAYGHASANKAVGFAPFAERPRAKATPAMEGST